MNQMQMNLPPAEIAELSSFNPAFTPGDIDFLAQNGIANPANHNQFAAVNQALHANRWAIPTAPANRQLPTNLTFDLPAIAQQYNEGEAVHQWTANQALARQERIRAFGMQVGAYLMDKMNRDLLFQFGEDEDEDAENENSNSFTKKKRSHLGLAA